MARHEHEDRNKSLPILSLFRSLQLAVHSRHGRAETRPHDNIVVSDPKKLGSTFVGLIVNKGNLLKHSLCIHEVTGYSMLWSWTFDS